MLFRMSTGCQKIRKTGRQTYRQTERQTDRQTDRKTERLKDLQGTVEKGRE